MSEEAKLSSSDRRKARLARLQRGDEGTWARLSEADAPYVVGLTGGIASGKSTGWLKMPRALLDDSAPSASLDRLKAQAAPTYPGAPPQRLGSLPCPE